MEEIEAGKSLNLLICALVVTVGFYWLYILDQKWTGKYRFLYRAFTCWWLAWLVWLLVFSLMIFKAPADNKERDILVLTISDLNAIFLALVYFNLTRGNHFRIKDAVYRSVSIIFPLALGYGALYLYFGGNSDKAYKIHQSIGLCVGFVTTMLLGWAFALRFNTKVVIVVGYFYGFSQPFVYEAAFHATESKESQQLFVVVLIILAFLKIILATVVTHYLLQKPETTENLVTESRSKAHLGFLQRWTIPVAVQTILLTTVFLYFLLRRMPDFFSEAMKTIGQLIGFYTILIAGVKLWGQLSSELNNRSHKPKNANDG